MDKHVSGWVDAQDCKNVKELRPERGYRKKGGNIHYGQQPASKIKLSGLVARQLWGSSFLNVRLALLTDKMALSQYFLCRTITRNRMNQKDEKYFGTLEL